MLKYHPKHRDVFAPHVCTYTYMRAHTNARTQGLEIGS